MIKGDDWVTIRKMMNDGISTSEIARQIGCSRTTVYKYAAQDTRPIYKRKKSGSRLDSYMDHIKSKLELAPFSSVLLFEEIKKQGYAGSLTTVKNFVRAVKKEYATRAVMRFETLPGQQAQVDWSHFGFIEVNGKRKRLHCFDFILGYSRTRFIVFTTSMDLDTFIACHILAFKYCKGAPKEILYDNMKTVVVKRVYRAKDSKMNERFMDFAGYYGFKPILCRPYRPQTKGKVENTVKYVRNNFFIGRTFVDLEDLNNQAMPWLEEINNKVHCTTKQIPFDRLKQENLTLVENRPDFDTSKVFYRTAGLDCLVHFEGSQYSVPLKYAGMPITVKISQNKPFQILYRGELICEHKQAKVKGTQIINAEHFEGIKELQYKTKKTYRNRKFARQYPITQTKVEVPILKLYDQLAEVKQ